MVIIMKKDNYDF